MANLFIADGIPPFQQGGMETHASAYIQHKKEEITPYSFELKEYSPAEANKIIDENNLSHVNFVLPFESIRNPQFLNNLIQKHSPETVFFNSIYWIKVLTQIKEINNKVKLILRSGGNDISQSNINNADTLEKRRDFVIKSINQNIDALIVNSSYTKEVFLQYGIHEKIMKILIGGVNIKQFVPVSPQKKQTLREKLNLPLNKFIGVAISRLVEFKNITAVLEIAKKITEDPNFLFMIVGDGPLFEKAKKYIQDNNLSKKIILTGEIANQNIQENYQIADYFLQMSTYAKTAVPSTKKDGESYIHTETMGRSIMEAMACGLPTIATNVGGVPEVVQNAGILIRDKNNEEAINAIQKLANDIFYRKDLGKKARQLAQSEYSWENIFKQYPV